MTIAQAENFYNQDKEQYNIKKNKELLTWLEKNIKSGYHPLMDIEDMQELIDNISYWYEMKYPERELAYYQGIIDKRFGNIKKLSKEMQIEQLFYRLPHYQLCLIECNYRGASIGQQPIYKNEKVIGYKTQLLLQIYKKDSNSQNKFNLEPSYFYIVVDAKDGITKIDYNLDKYNKNTDILLDDLLSILNKKYNDKLDYKEIKECIYRHNCDMELRNKVLQLVALKLLYSKNTIPENGYIRAKRMIHEFNKVLDLKLTTEEIDEIMKRDYNKEENQINNTNKEKPKKIKKLINKVLSKR